jgi:SAM-dependent methyltransferase
VIALELDASAAEHAARRYPTVRIVRADCCRLPVADGSVDAVVGLQVIEHLHCAEGFVEACARALRPGGRLILSTPNRATFPGGLNPFHTHEYVAAELEGLLGTAFRDVRVLGLVHRGPLRLLDRALREPIQHRLVRDGYDGVPAWTRAMLRTVTSRDFRTSADADRALDLLAVATGTIEG